MAACRIIPISRAVCDHISPYLADFEIDYVEYPHEVTLKAKKVDNITNGSMDNTVIITTMQLSLTVLGE